MQREHCQSDDSGDKFTTGNYEITTTSQIEWGFTTSPQSGPEHFAKAETLQANLKEQETYLTCEFPEKLAEVKESKRLVSLVIASSRLSDRCLIHEAAPFPLTVCFYW